jgi:hypothetical protein
MAAELENDRRENVRKLSQAHDMSARMVYAALMRTAKLSKKSARWVKKRFFLEMKKGQKGKKLSSKKLIFFSSPIFYRRFLWQRTIFAEFRTIF